MGQGWEHLRRYRVAPRTRSPTPSFSLLPEDASYAKILRLQVLHKLNIVEAEQQRHPDRSLPELAFVDNQLSAKLTRQLEGPMIVTRYGLKFVSQIASLMND
jgi:hypothetical protein